MKNLFRWEVSGSEDTAITFIARHFDVDQAALATDDRLEKFRSLVRDNHVVIAAKEYEELTGRKEPQVATQLAAPEAGALRLASDVRRQTSDVRPRTSEIPGRQPAET